MAKRIVHTMSNVLQADSRWSLFEYWSSEEVPGWIRCSQECFSCWATASMKISVST